MVIIGKDGSFEYVNPKFTQMFGYGLEEVPDGKTWFRKAYPDAPYRHEVIRTWLGGALESGKGEMTSQIFKVKCKSGELKIVQFRPVQLESGQYLITCEDITELTKAAEALRLEKAKFQVLAENLPLGVVMISKDGTYAYVNPKFTQMFGYDLNDVPNGREWFKKAFPDPRYRDEAMDQRPKAGGTAPKNLYGNLQGRTA
jgi:PAS domain S-box-containing protein